MFRVPTIAVAFFATALTCQASPIFINELHYDNVGQDTGEFFEIAGPAGTDLSGYQVFFYNGSTGAAYANLSLGGNTIPDQSAGFGTLAFFTTFAIQNGSPDGLAIVDPGDNVLEFVSYEGVLTAANGVAAGLTSTDIGVSETSSTPIGSSLQRQGLGSDSSDFAFVYTPGLDTPGLFNSGQGFAVVSEPSSLVICAMGLLALSRHRARRCCPTP